MSALLQRLEKSGLPFRYECKNGVESYKINPTCGAHCKSTGRPCLASVPEVGARCRWHGGLSTGPKTPEGRAAIANANRKRKGTRYKLPKAPTVAPVPVLLTPAQKLQRDADRELKRRARSGEGSARPSQPAQAQRDADPNAALIAQLESMTPEERHLIEQALLSRAADAGA